MKGIETKLDFVRQAFASVTGPRISFCAPARCAAAEVDGAELLDTLVRITRFRCDWEDEMLGRSLGVLALLLTGGASASAQDLTAPSTWTGQRASVLSISAVDSSGNIKGTYLNNAAGTDCINSAYDVGGKLSGDTIVFYVTFSDCNTVTIWNGRIRGSTIITRFESAYPDKGGQLKLLWGNDIFTRR